MAETAPSSPKFILVHGYPQQEIHSAQAHFAGGLLQANPEAVALVAVGSIGRGQPNLGEQTKSHITSNFPDIDPSRVRVIGEVADTPRELEAFADFARHERVGEAWLFSWESHGRRIGRMLDRYLPDIAFPRSKLKVLTTFQAVGLVEPELAKAALEFVTPQARRDRKIYDDRLYILENSWAGLMVSGASMTLTALGVKHIAEGALRTRIFRGSS